MPQIGNSADCLFPQVLMGKMFNYRFARLKRVLPQTLQLGMILAI